MLSIAAAIFYVVLCAAVADYASPPEEELAGGIMASRTRRTGLWAVYFWLSFCTAPLLAMGVVLVYKLTH